MCIVKCAISVSDRCHQWWLVLCAGMIVEERVGGLGGGDIEIGMWYKQAEIIMASPLLTNPSFQFRLPIHFDI